jgi:exopolyphosphatase / guanosine-5'-triphosphate,3'-diphosphate pyrophosphatase
MAEYSTLAAVDLGSNSFHCQIARVVGDQVYPLDALREPVRLGGGLTEDKLLDEASQQRALDCLGRFAERLRGFDRHAVRAVATNTLRVAKNAAAFLRAAESALGFHIEVISGREEARLIYVGVAHSLTPSRERRLVIDIGGGSTEIMIGSGYKPEKLVSLFMGCVSYSMRFFPQGKISKSAMKEAELAARGELHPVANDFSRKHWQSAFGSSGTVRAIAEILLKNGFDDNGITSEGLQRLRAHLVKTGNVGDTGLASLRGDRAPVLPGGLAILSAVLTELAIDRLEPAPGALREGVLYDLLGRVHRRDMRHVTVGQFMQRYHVDAAQARRIGLLANRLYEQFSDDEKDPDEETRAHITWAAQLHEIGISVAYSGYHKHSAYILQNADMPGFSSDEQIRLSHLVLAHRRSLKKILPMIEGTVALPALAALRLAVLLYRGRSSITLPKVEARYQGRKVKLTIDGDWLIRNPLTAAALREEIREWEKVGIDLRVSGLDAVDAEAFAVG